MPDPSSPRHAFGSRSSSGPGETATSRRGLLAAIGVGGIGLLAGCVGGDVCETAIDSTWEVDPSDRIETAIVLEVGLRLYVRSISRRGGAPSLTIESPDGEVVRRAGPSDRLEAVYEADQEGPHAIELRNDSAVQGGVWETTIVRYDGWCRAVF